MDQVRERVRSLHYSRRTEQAYVYWSKAFIRFHSLRHPNTMGGPEVEAFLTHLAADRGLAASSHRQALSALLFLYGKVLGQQLPWMTEIGRPLPKRRLPVVLSPDEVADVLGRMEGVHQLLARLLYGTGLRISEARQLRVKDIDFAQHAVFVRAGKGDKDRVVMLPQSLVAAHRQSPAARPRRSCIGYPRTLIPKEPIMKKLKVTIELEMSVPDDWEMVATSEGTPVIKLPNDEYLDIAIEPLFASNPEETWSSTEDEEVLNDILDMVESEAVTYEFVNH